MDGREHEPDAGAADAFRHLVGLQVDARAERFEHVGGAGLARHAAIAVFRDLGAGRGRDEHRCGRNVERVRAIAAGADDVDEVRIGRDLDTRGELAHHLGRAGDLADRLLLHAQAGEQGRGDDRRHFATHDLAEQVHHLVVEDLAMFDGARQRFLRSDGHGYWARKFFSMAWPCWVMIDSGWNCTPWIG